MATNACYKMELSLNVLEHLGINLYSNVPAVISEVVANAWDADAESVEITRNQDKDQIIIQDNGSGMTTEEVNCRFLRVGYRRRDEQPGLTPKGRLPMGRKGIGKLSLFSIAQEITVETIKNGEVSAFRMNLDDIRQAIQGGEGNYEPEAINTNDIDLRKGTRITLNGIKKRQTIRTSEALRKRLARRFSIIGPKQDFEIIVDRKQILPADRGYYNKVQYLWTYDDQSEILDLASNQEKCEDRTTFIKNSPLSINGWLGTVEKSDDLKDEDGENLNHIAIFIRGKMAQEDLLSDFTERGVYASYLIGELHVDSLDDDDKPDAATSSRQKIVEDDERYVNLRDLLGKELKYIQSKWSEWRSEAGAKKALDIPAVKTWMDDLPKDIKPKAKSWLGKLNRIRTDDPVEHKKLIKHAVLAFEFYRCNKNIESLEQIHDDNLQSIIELFTELDSLEVNLYGQIVQQRIAVIRTLQEKVDTNTRERAIQEYIFDHLWLIDPAWERAEATEVMESRVSKLFKEIDAKLSDEEKTARIDIKYRTTAGAHIIIELKRPGRPVGIYEIAEQIRKYRSGMLKLLQKMSKDHEPVEFVCLLGDNPREWSDLEGQSLVRDTLAPLRARIVLYDSLLDNAYKTYQDYLNSRKTVDRLTGIIGEIDDYSA
jgi:hypothetical protein